jgi:hypothetical protein
MNTIESNKLIAEFMGAKLFVNDGAIILYKLNSKTYHIGSMNYDTDYNWLMPVVHKIKQLGESENVYSVEFEKLKLTDPIERIYKVVIEFIQWYNKLGRKLP